MTTWSGADIGTLRRVVLDPTALIPLIQADPERAAEMMLAAVLEAPGDHEVGGLEIGMGIVNSFGSAGPLPERGPMLGFLMHAPDVGLRTIMQIVDHATEGWAQTLWAEIVDDGITTPFEIIIDGEPVTLAGNGNVMHWYRGDARVPKPLACALMAIEQHLYRKLDAGEDVDDLLATLMTSRSVAVFGVLVSVACYRPNLLEGRLAPLVTSAALILSDRLYKARDHSYLGWSFTLTEARQLQRWHDMPHRKTPIDHRIMPMVVAEGLLGSELAAARTLWAKDPDDRWRFLIAQMDPANYHATELEDGTVGWPFVMPERLRAEIEADQADLSARQWWLAAPMSLAQAVADDTPISDADAEAFWVDVQAHLSAPPPDDFFDDGVLRQADVECGAAALLLTRAATWTETRPDVTAFCRKALLQPFVDLPRSHPFDSPVEPTETSWDGFAATAIPLLWKRDPADTELRSAALRLATNSHLATVSHFFAAAVGHPELADDIRRLEIVALHWARYASWSNERHRREQRAEYWSEGAPTVNQLPDLGPSTEAILNAFVDATLTIDAPALADFIDDTPPGLLPETVHGRYRIAHALQVSYLLAAWGHVLSLPDGLSDAERERRLEVAAQFASVFASGLVPDDRGSVRGTPAGEERSLHALLGAIVARASAAPARRIWEPILALGAAAHYWVTDFIDEVWTSALREELPPPRYAALIKEMMAFTAGHDSWHGPRSDELDLALLCLSRFHYPRMEERHRPLLADLQPEWAQLAAANMRSSYSARAIVAFLGEPVAMDFVESGIGWLAAREREGARSDDDLDAETAELLAKLGGRDPGLFRRADTARDVLGALVARQNPVALQISARLGGAV